MGTPSAICILRIVGHAPRTGCAGRRTRRLWLLATLLLTALGLAGCDAEEGTCELFGAAAPVGAVRDDLEACLRCTCNAPGAPGCTPLPGCGDAGRGGAGGAGAAGGAGGGAGGGDLGRLDASPGDLGPGDLGSADQGPEDQGGRPCPEGATRCLDTGTEARCTAGVWAPAPCGDGLRCLAATCVGPTCAASGQGCAGGRLVFCDDEGFPERSEACPAGQVCAAGQCLSAEPNVVLLVDTSGSMGSPVLPERPAPFPACEDPIEPYTRLGVVKLALDRVFASRSVESLRLALMTFPQALTQGGTCPRGHRISHRALADLGQVAAAVSPEIYAGIRPRMVAVPIVAETEGSDRAALARWVDFGERLAEVGPDCQVDCAGICGPGGVCIDAIDPELRPDGGTPFGRSLAIAGEYLSREVWRDGNPCAEHADCASPHYQCIDNLCVDLLGNCRGQVVVTFSDGEETSDTVIQAWYHPINQARRLGTGLTCQANTDCARGAFCHNGECTRGVCPRNDVPCVPGEVACADGGECVPLAVPANGFAGSLRPAGPDGRPKSVRVHVVDVSGSATNAQVARWGAGSYTRIAQLEPQGLIEVFTPLFQDAKDQTLRCVSNQ